MKPVGQHLLTALVLLTLTGCSAYRWEQPEPPASSGKVNEPLSRSMERTKRGNPPFYEVFGVRYEVMSSSTGYKERGIASWYGKKFHGRQTSNGERYDMYRMTAAHKKLPLPTNVKVTNLKNGRSIVVRVNDRGPFVKNRLIDLSYAAAKELDIITAGTAMVEVEAVDMAYTGPITAVAPAAGATPAPVPEAAPAAPVAVAAAAPPAATRMYVQVGAFGERQNASNLAAQLADSGLEQVSVESSADAPPVYRVRIGPFATVSDYDRILAQVEDLQIRDTHLVVDDAPATATP